MVTDARGPRIIARSFFRQLRAEGYSPKQLIGVASELIELITCLLRESRKVVEAAVAPTDGSHNSAETTPSSRTTGVGLYPAYARKSRDE